MKILIVDSNEDVALAVQLGLFEHDASMATTPEQSLQCVRRTHFDSCLVELGISGGGAALLARLRAAALDAHGRTITRTVSWDGSVPEEWGRSQAGFDCFPFKPVGLEHIAAAALGHCCPHCDLPYEPQSSHIRCVAQQAKQSV